MDKSINIARLRNGAIGFGKSNKSIRRRDKQRSRSENYEDLNVHMFIIMRVLASREGVRWDEYF